MRDTAGRAASDEHELQIGFASTSTTNEGREAARCRCCRRPGEGSPRFFCLHPLSSFISFVFTALFMQQASRAGKQDLVCFQCNAFCLKREQAEQPFVFLNTIFLSKRNIGWWAHERQQLEQQDHQEGKAARQQRQPQQRQQEGEKGSSSKGSMGACAGGTHPKFLCLW